MANKIKLPNSVSIVVLLAIVIGVRVVILAVSHVYPIPSTIETREFLPGADAVDYIRYAKNLAFHASFSHSAEAPFHPSAFRPPLYSLCIAPFFRVFSTDRQSILWITSAQVALAGLNALLIYWIGRRVTGRSRLAWVGSLLASLDLHSIQLNFQIMSDTLFITLFLASVLSFLGYIEKQYRFDLICFTILLALAGLCRVIALYLIPLFLCFVALRATGFRKKALDVILTGIVFSILLMPWVLRNWKTIGIPCITTMDTYQKAILAQGLLAEKQTGRVSPGYRIFADDMDRTLQESLDELRQDTGTRVSFDSGIRFLVALDQPELTPRFNQILESKSKPVIESNRLLHLKTMTATFFLLPFDTYKGLLCRILGAEGDGGFGPVFKAFASLHVREALHLTSQLGTCKILGNIWTYGYLCFLNTLAVIGCVVVFFKHRHGLAMWQWGLLFLLICFLLAAPSYSAGLGGELARFRAPAIPLMTMFMMVGCAFVSEQLSRRGFLRKNSGTVNTVQT